MVIFGGGSLLSWFPNTCEILLFLSEGRCFWAVSTVLSAFYGSTWTLNGMYECNHTQISSRPEQLTFACFEPSGYWRKERAQVKCQQTTMAKVKRTRFTFTLKVYKRKENVTGLDTLKLQLIRFWQSAVYTECIYIMHYVHALKLFIQKSWTVTLIKTVLKPSICFLSTFRQCQLMW